MYSWIKGVEEVEMDKKSRGGKDGWKESCRDFKKIGLFKIK